MHTASWIHDLILHSTLWEEGVSFEPMLIGDPTFQHYQNILQPSHNLKNQNSLTTHLTGTFNSLDIEDTYSANSRSS